MKIQIILLIGIILLNGCFYDIQPTKDCCKCNLATSVCVKNDGTFLDNYDYVCMSIDSYENSRFKYMKPEVCYTELKEVGG